MLKYIAWTGGSKPGKLREITKTERQLRSAIFHENMQFVYQFWQDYRGLNNTVLESARIHYNRARYDAHATIREVNR